MYSRNIKVVLFVLCTSIIVATEANTSGNTTPTLTTTSEPTKLTLSDEDAMLDKIQNGVGFLAALDQSGGSTPRALSFYGFPKELYEEGETSMFDAVHQMRTRIVTSKAFQGDQILGAILFEGTMDRMVDGKPTAQYLWEEKKVVPFLKIDKGLLPEENGVQLMKEIPALEALLKRAKTNGIFGTKMRSVIKSNSPDGIKAVVDQQFQVGKKIIDSGLVPIIEPEVDIFSSDKMQCEEVLKANIMAQLDQLRENDRVILKVSLPCLENFYQECINHPKCIRVVALSGGFSRNEANELLCKQREMIASFSRALTEGLTHGMSDDDFDKVLGQTIDSICSASNT